MRNISRVLDPEHRNWFHILMQTSAAIRSPVYQNTEVIVERIVGDIRTDIAYGVEDERNQTDES